MNPAIRSLVAGLVLLLAGLPGPARAHLGLLGGFRPVAAEEGARAVWTNPAAVGLSGRGTALAELSLRDDAGRQAEDGSAPEWELPTGLTALCLAAATDKLGYGFQMELEDQTGVPQWTLAVGNRVRMGRNLHAGMTAEWRGGGDGLEAAAGVLVPLGRSIRTAAVVRDLLAKDTDGVSGERWWQLGAALEMRPLLGRLTWDVVLTEEPASPVHWIGFALDRAQAAHLSFARSSEGDWSASFHLAFPHHLLGIGAIDRGESGAGDPHRAWLAAEWQGLRNPGTSVGTGR